MTEDEAELALKKITFLNQLLGKDSFIVRYGSIKDLYNEFGIKRILDSQVTDKYSTDGTKRTFSGFNVVLTFILKRPY